MAWTWACLSCNEVGDAPSADGVFHKHAPGMAYVRDVFVRIVQWHTGRDYDAATAAIALPIPRARVAELLGPSWLPAGDIA
jgi:hypothetical protein